MRLIMSKVGSLKRIKQKSLWQDCPQKEKVNSTGMKGDVQLETGQKLKLIGNFYEKVYIL